MCWRWRAGVITNSFAGSSIWLVSTYICACVELLECSKGVGAGPLVLGVRAIVRIFEKSEKLGGGVAANKCCHRVGKSLI